MGEARRKRLQNRANKFLSGLTGMDFNKVEEHLVNQGHKPDYIEPYQMKDVVVITHTPPLPSRDPGPDKPHTKTYTPAAEWRERGDPDPHAGQYDDKERHEIMGGQYTDDEIAFKCGMASGRDLESITVLYMAKDRIRWLSRKLVAAEKRIAELEGKK